VRNQDKFETKRLGNYGERVAEIYLIKHKKHKILARNLRIGGVEVDIVSCLGPVIYISEVKTRAQYVIHETKTDNLPRETYLSGKMSDTNNSYYHPEDNLSYAKIERLNKARTNLIYILECFMGNEYKSRASGFFAKDKRKWVNNGLIDLMQKFCSKNHTIDVFDVRIFGLCIFVVFEQNKPKILKVRMFEDIDSRY
jgi:Holliday junction resolvase-like predicted endonuclease